MKDQLLAEDLHHVVSRVPRDLCKLLRETRGLFLGGGFVRSVLTHEEISDIDLFGLSKDALEAVAKRLAGEREGARVHATDNAFTVLTPGRLPVQFIHRWTYERPEQLLADFDFTISQAVIWFDSQAAGSKWRSLISLLYYADLASRRLRYLSPSRNEDAGGSLMRVRKFLHRGYHIEAPSLAKAVARLAHRVDPIRDHTEEAWLGQVLTGLLREVDPLTVIDGIELIDEQQITDDIGRPDA